MSRHASLRSSGIQLLHRFTLAIAAVVVTSAATAQTVSVQAISEPEPIGQEYRAFSSDGQWVCFARDSLRCALSNSSTLATLHNPPEQSGSLIPRFRFVPETNRILYPREDSGGKRRLWTVVAGDPQSAADVTPQWPAANIEEWIVSDQGDLVLFVEDGGDRAIYFTRVDVPTPFIEIGSNIAIGSLTRPAQFASGGQAVHVLVDGRIWRVPLDASPAIPMSQQGASAQPELDEHGGYLYFRAKVSGSRVDLFRVALTGGVAQLLSLDATHTLTARPFFAPDGSFACFLERRQEYDLACSDLRGASPQTVGFGTVVQVNLFGGGGPTGQHLIASDNRTLFGICDRCQVGRSLYRARADASVPVTVLTGPSVQVFEIRDLPAVGRVLFRVRDENTSTFGWQSTNYDFTQPVDYPFTGDFIGYDADSDRLTFLTDVNPFPGVELQLVSVRSDGSDEMTLTGGGFGKGIEDAFATPDGTAVIVQENYLSLPGPSEGVRLARVRVDGSEAVVLASFPQTGAQAPIIGGTALSPTDSYGTASQLFDENLRSQVITYSGPPAPLFHDGFEPEPPNRGG